MGGNLTRLLAGEVEHDRDVVSAEAPEGVLVRSQLAQVQAVAVDVVDLVAQLARIRQLLQLLHAGVILEQVPDHQDAPVLLCRANGALGVGDRLRERLLDEAVLAGLQNAHGEIRMRRDRRRQRDRVELRIGEQLVEVGNHPRCREHRGHAVTPLLRRIAAVGELAARHRSEVPGQVRAPVAEAGDRDPQTRLCHGDGILIARAV
jgi:hypothetical protein